MLNVSVENLGEVVVLRCQGDLVGEEESTLLCTALGNHGHDIVVDLGEVDTIDAAGSGALLWLCKWQACICTCLIRLASCGSSCAESAWSRFSRLSSTMPCQPR